MLFGGCNPNEIDTLSAIYLHADDVLVVSEEMLCYLYVVILRGDGKRLDSFGLLLEVFANLALDYIVVYCEGKNMLLEIGEDKSLYSVVFFSG